MKKFYLFEIRKEFYKIYKKNSFVLYKTLENLHNLQRENLNYGISLFNQICNIIDKKNINNKLIDYIKINDDKYLVNEYNEETIITIKNTYICYNTNMDIPKSMSKIYSTDKHFFVIDFKEKDYFWLSDHITSKSKYTII